MAGLIPQGFVDDLLNRTDLVEVVGERISLKKAGRNFTACCPFHQEKTPSFSVSPDKQFYYCFGCGAGGNAIGFVMDHDHLGFPEAVESLARRAGVEVPREESNRPQPPRQPAQSPLFDILQAACSFYSNALHSHPARQQAVSYLSRRGISKDIAGDFLLGYAPPGWDNLHRELGGDSLKEKYLLEAGLLAENADSGRRYDRFRDRIIFPIRDSRGRVIGFGGRVLGDDKPKYLNSPETPVFHKGQELYGLYEARQHNRQLQDILVVEGYMDVIALAQQGLRNAVATLGTATTPEHIKRLLRIVPTITFCFDGDNAGRKAAWRALEATLEHMKDGISARFLFLPDGSDPDDLVRSEGADAFKARITSQSLSLSDYFFRHLAEDLDMDSLEGKAHMATLASPLIAAIPGHNLQKLMERQLLQLTGLGISQPTARPRQAPAPVQQDQTATPDWTQDTPPAWTDSYEPAGNTDYSPRPPSASRPAKPSRNNRPLQVEAPHLVAIRSLLHQPQLAFKVESARNLAQEDDPHAQLLVSLLEALQKTPQPAPIQLIARWQGTEQGLLLRSLAEKEWLIEQDNLEQQFIDTIACLSSQQREMMLNRLLALARSRTLDDSEKQHLNHLLAQKHRKPLATGQQ
ncbi:MAG: DNA primase [Thiopseudomonas sp.]|nr:DNA primase [Thiopseudomonas sp.]